MASLTSGPQPGRPASSVDLPDLDLLNVSVIGSGEGEGHHCPAAAPDEPNSSLRWPGPLPVDGPAVLLRSPPCYGRICERTMTLNKLWKSGVLCPFSLRPLSLSTQKPVCDSKVATDARGQLPQGARISTPL